MTPRAWRLGLFCALSVISVASFLWWGLNIAEPAGLGHLVNAAIFLGSQLILTIWCLRDLYRRRFPDNRTLVNWLTIVVLFGVVGTTAYMVFVMKAQSLVRD